MLQINFTPMQRSSVATCQAHCKQILATLSTWWHYEQMIK